MDNVEVEREVSERECAIAYLHYEINRLNDMFFAGTWTEDWKTWTPEEIALFRGAIEALHGCGSLHREKFDSTVWKGHSDGTVNPTVESIRKQREGDAPGKKAEVLTPAQILAKRLKK
jgi:hypothetical protein